MSYRVKVTREGDQWLAEVPDVPGAHTFAKSLEALRTAVREVVVLMDDLDDGADVELAFDYDLSDRVAATAAQIGSERAALLAAEEEVQAKTRTAALALVDGGYSQRDVAVLLNMTPGRVTQIVRPKEASQA